MSVVVDDGFVPSPTGRACTDLTDDVAGYVLANNDGAALTKARDCLRSAVSKLNTRNWEWNKVHQLITMVADTATYTLNDSFRAPRSSHLLNSDGSMIGRLGYKDPQSFWYDHDKRDEAGSPCYYTVENPHALGTIRLDVIPSSAWVGQYPTIKLWYYRRTLPCSESVVSLNVPEEVSDWVAWQAKAHMAAHYDMGKVEYARDVADQMWRLLIQDVSRSQVTDEE